MNRVLEFLQLSRLNNVMLCTAGDKKFCRLGTVGRWSITEKEMPLEFINGRQKDVMFCCIGYGETIDQAIEEAFQRLPG